MAKIYIAEDDQGIRDLILYTLQVSGYEARGFENGLSLLEAVREEKPDLVLLDIMMPDADGLAILRQLRNHPDTEDLPVIMETAKTTESDTVTGLDAGADDYLTKPFGMAEMISRIRALLRRSRKQQDQDDQPLVCGPVMMKPREHEVFTGGEPVTLTRKEYALLRLLLSAPRKVFTRDELLVKVWDTDFAGGTRTVDVHVNTLRQKLKEGGKAIETVRGAGYRMNPGIFEKETGQAGPEGGLL